MDSSKRLLRRLDDLIDKGHTAGVRDISSPFYVSSQSMAAGWRTQSLNFLSGLMGEDAEYTKEFRKTTETYFQASPVQDGTAILESLREDIENGYLQTYRQQLSAEFVGDLIQQAEHLHENTFHQAAVSIAGAALEGGLREVATSNGITLNGREDMNSLADKLVGAKILNNLERDQLRVLIKIRNAADHAEFEGISEDDVTRMIRDARDFLVKHAT